MVKKCAASLAQPFAFLIDFFNTTWGNFVHAGNQEWLNQFDAKATTANDPMPFNCPTAVGVKFLGRVGAPKAVFLLLQHTIDS